MIKIGFNSVKINSAKCISYMEGEDQFCNEHVTLVLKCEKPEFAIKLRLFRRISYSLL